MYHRWALLRRHPVVGEGVGRCLLRVPKLAPPVRAETDGVAGRSSPEGVLSETCFWLLVAIGMAVGLGFIGWVWMCAPELIPLGW